MRIFIPSYKRAGGVLTRKTLGGAGVIACHEFEAEDYAAKEGGELMVLPDALRGNIAKVRNFILDHAEAADGRVVMMDDDIHWICRHQQGKQYKLTPEAVFAFLDHGYAMAQDLGVHLWGVNLNQDPQNYREYRPLSLLAPVLGTMSCHLAPELRYDEGLHLNEDYDFFLKNIERYRKVLRFNNHAYFASHLERAGGCGAYRLKGEELRQAEVMRRRWGSKVFKFDIAKSTNGRVHVPLPGA